MKFALLVSAGPSVQAPRTALRFAQAAVEAGHSVPRVFFYGDGIHVARSGARPAPGDQDVTAAWSAFATARGADLVVCVAAAERRALAEEGLAPGFRISGLGQWVEAAAGCDRVLSFPG